MGESTSPRAKLRFDRRVRLEFRGATITSDAGLLACRELDDALGLTETANECLQESRGGRNVQHRLVGLLRQSVYSRLAGYEDTNDAERLADDPTMRVSVGSYRPVIAGAKLREGKTTILPRGGERSGESACLQCAFTPLAGARRRQRWTRNMVHGTHRIPYWIDRRLTGLAGPDYDATISIGLPFEPEDSQYGEYRFPCSSLLY